jgi:hypothetical protein
MTEAARFIAGLQGILGMRLTYDALIGSELRQTS